jgi:hypothetical protein
LARLSAVAQKAWVRNLAVALVLLCLNLIFVGGLWRGESLVGKDTLTFSLSYAEILHRALVQGHIPLWSQLLNFPAHAESQGAFLYPPNIIIYLLWDAAGGYNLTVILHLLFMSWGMYLLGRHHSLGRLASILAATIFTYGSFITLRVNINNFFTNGAWAPWIILAALIVARKPRPLSIAGLVITTAMMLLTGHFQITAYTLLVAVIMAFARTKSASGWKAAWKSLLWTSVGIALGVMIASPQLLPTLELAGMSARGSQSYISLTDYSLFPPQLISLILPALFGRADHPIFFGYQTVNYYWGQGSFWELTLYLSAVGLVLAILAASRKGWRLYGILAAIFLLLSLGKYLPGYQILAHIPPFSLFRIPARLGFIAVLLGSLLAGVGLDGLPKQSTNSGRRAIWLLGICLAAMVAVLTIANVVGAGAISSLAEGKGLSEAGKLVRRDFLNSAIAQAINPWQLNHLIPLGMVMLVLVISVLLRWDKITAGFAALVIFLAAVAELMQFGMDYNRSCAPNIYAMEPPAAKYLAAQKTHRIFASGWDILPGEEGEGFAMLHPNSAALWNLAMATPRGSLLPAADNRVAELLEDALTVPGDGSFPHREKKSVAVLSNPRALQMCGIDYIVRLHPLAGDGITQVGDFDGVLVYHLDGALPRAYLVGSVELESDAAAALTRAVNGNWDFLSHAVVDRPIAGIDKGSGNITAWHEGDNQLQAKVTTDEPQLLVLDRLYYPGWQAKWDGEATDIILVNGWQIGIVAPAGEHRLALEFRYRSWGWSLAFAGIGLAGLLVLLVLSFVNHRKSFT